MRVSKRRLHLVATVVLAAALAVIAWGLDAGAPTWWAAGLGMLAAAMAIAFTTRFVPD